MSKFLYVDYTNHRGERRWREIDLDAEVRYTFTAYPPTKSTAHKAPPGQMWQPCIDVQLTDRKNRRTLALASCHGFSLVRMPNEQTTQVKDNRPRTQSRPGDPVTVGLIYDGHGRPEGHPHFDKKDRNDFGKEEPRVTDAIVDAVRDDLRARSAVGIGKYGTTLAASDEPLRKRLRHAYEEVLDLANYLKWADQKIVADEIDKAAEPFQHLHDRIDLLSGVVKELIDDRDLAKAKEVMLSELDRPADGSGMAMASEASPIDRHMSTGIHPTILRSDLSFYRLRTANIERQKFWDKHGKLTGNLGLLYRANELAGEAGEVCNKVKKWVRERLDIPGSRTTMEEIENEIADVVICCDLLATDLKFDLARAVRDKFNMTSAANKLPVELRFANTVYVDGKEMV